VKTIFGNPSQLILDGCPIHYWLTGPENAPLMIMTHGGYVEHSMFASQVEEFKKNYRILTWDIRGHGESTPFQGDLAYRTIAEDMHQIFLQVQNDPVILIGQSMGGCAGQEFSFLHPQKVKALVLIGSPRISEPLNDESRMSNTQLAEAAQSMSETDLQHFMQGAADYFSIQPEVQTYVRAAAGRLTKPTFQAVFQAVLGGFSAHPGQDIQVPLLLVHGDRDFPAISSQMRAWSQTQTNCHYAVIPNAGHQSNQDNPQAFNAVLSAFLKTLS
jgi:pimeloyl-ACP methyl ester carboxylesterase